MITKYEKTLRITSAIIAAATSAVTRPAIRIYFMSHVSQSTLALSNMISIGLAVIVSGLLSKEGNVVPLRRKYFVVFMAIDTIAYGVLSYLGVAIDVRIRFIGMAIVEALSTGVSVIIVRDALNLVLSGTKLTAFQNQIGMFDSMAGFAALSVFMLVNIDMSVEIALTMNVVAMSFSTSAEALFVYSINRREREHRIKEGS